MSHKIDRSRIKPEFVTTAGQWIYVCCVTFIQFPSSSGVHCSFSFQCNSCGNTNLRFQHILEHIQDARQISVGIECASALLEDDELPRLAENEVKRKERWRIYYRKPGRCSVDIVDLQNRGKL